MKVPIRKKLAREALLHGYRGKGPRRFGIDYLKAEARAQNKRARNQTSTPSEPPVEVGLVSRLRAFVRGIFRR